MYSETTLRDVIHPGDHSLELSGVRKALNIVLFDTRTLSGKLTNWLLLLLIIAVVVASMLATIHGVGEQWGSMISQFEMWVLYAFAAEYLLRVYAARNRKHYILSFNGLVDLMTVLPLFIVGGSMVMVRLLRLARVIRIAISFPVVRALFASLKGSAQLLLGVLGTILLISVLIGNMIYILEPGTFANAFEGTWWSLVTMSTVGYGDFVPKTGLGKMVAAGLIMSGICMFAMVTAVIAVKVGQMVNNSVRCRGCQHGISDNYLYCPHCAAPQREAQAVEGEG